MTLVTRVLQMFDAWQRHITGLSALRAHLLAAVMGVLYTLGFAPYYLVPAALVGMTGLALIIHACRETGGAFVVGWWFGFGHFLTSLYWVGNSFSAQDQFATWMAPIAVMALVAALALYPALASAVAQKIGARGFGRLLVLGLLFALAEWLRGNLFTGFPWNLPAYIWGWSPSLMQPVALIGTYGLSLVTLLALFSPVTLFDSNLSTRSRLMAPLFSVAAFTLIGLWGMARLDGAPSTNVGGVKLRLVQANIAQIDKWDRVKARDNYLRYVDMSRERLVENDITHVIWPETAVTYLFEESDERRFLLARALGDASLITGSVRRERDGSGTMRPYNSLHVMAADARITATYDKVHLVPFGEYLPFRSVLSALGLNRLVPGTSDFAAGPGPQTISVPGLPAFSPLICYEIIFPGRIIADGPRPRWLLNITNDGWFGESNGPLQHFASARFRAIEEGLPVIRVAGTGITAVVDAHGRVKSSIALGKQGKIDVRLPEAYDGLTPFARYGNRIFIVLWLLLLIPATSMIRRKW